MIHHKIVGLNNYISNANGFICCWFHNFLNVFSCIYFYGDRRSVKEAKGEMNINDSDVMLPKTVIFDVDNTLYFYAPAHRDAIKAVEEKVVEILGVKIEEFKQAYNESWEEIKERLGNVVSPHSRLLYIQSTIEKLGLGARILLTLDLEQTYWRTFLNNCKLFPGVLDFLQLLKNKGIITANVTDLTSKIQFRKLICFGLDEFFDYVVTSEEVDRDKLDREGI